MSGGSAYLKERHAERQFYLNLGESITTPPSPPIRRLTTTRRKLMLCSGRSGETRRLPSMSATRISRRSSTIRQGGDGNEQVREL